LALPALRAAGVTDAGAPWSNALRDAWLTVAYDSGSDELFVPVQDVFGWTDRINVPATIGDHNWTWRLPWPVDRLADISEARERADFCHRAATAARRHRSSPE
jgi:4-alpha-glucanotransferase